MAERGKEVRGNPWLEIPLEEYEAHMDSPLVEQARLLADLLREAVESYAPNSVAVLGTAGGNGLDGLGQLGVRRMVAVDIQPEYLKECTWRYAQEFVEFEPVECDLSLGAPVMEAVDMVYAALVLEYINVERFVQYAPGLVREGGRMVFVFQMPGSVEGTVTKTGIASVESLAAVHVPVRVEEVVEALAAEGFELEERRVVRSVAGKEFLLVVMKRG